MENETNKYLSNAPKSDSEFYKEATNVLVAKINDNDIKNIGIVAPYGAGKSSLIKTYKDENNKASKKDKKKIIEISLLDLTTEVSEKPKKKGAGNFNDSLLEKSILEQMFFKENKRKLPLSRIDRIHGKFWISLLKSLLIVLSIIFVLLSILELNHNLPCSNGDHFYLFSGIASLFVLAALTSFIVSSNISKVSIQNIEVEFTKIKNGSVLNLFLDEIIYYFKRTKIDVVVFEDIDRFESINLFTKLREINQIINDNSRINRKITFIYCVSDTFFVSASDRAKFFDFIISLLPILTPKSVSDHILKSVGSEQLSDLFVQRISRFIDEKRILNNIVNDYFFFKKFLNIEGDIDKNEKLFSMMTYKNLCFMDYVLLQKGEGDLVKIFDTKKAELIKRNTKALQNQIKDIDEKIEESKNSNLFIKNITHLKEMIFGVIAKSGNASTSAPNGYFDINSIETFKDIKTGIFINFSVVAAFYGTASRINSIKYMDIDAISKILQQSPFEIELQIKGEYQKPLYKEKTNLYNTIQKISGMKMEELLSLNYAIDGGDELTSNNYLSFAIRNGYIDESYFIYVGQTNSKINSTFIDNVVSDKPQDVEQHLDNCELIVDSLNDNEFGNKYILNYSLIQFLFTHEEYANKKTTLLNYLSSGDKEAIRFIANYYSLGYESTVLITELTKKNVNIVNDLIQVGTLTQDQINNMLMFLFLKKDEIEFKSIDNKDSISDFIRNYNHVLEAFLPIADKNDIIDYLNTFNVDKITNIDYVECDNKLWENLMTQVVDKCMFEINFANIKTIELYYLKENTINVSSLLKCDKPIADYFKSNISRFISEIVNNVNNLSEDNDVVASILSDNNIDISIKESFILKLENEIDYDDKYSPEICLLLLKNNRLSKKWSNLSTMLKKEIINSNDLSIFIEKNNESFLDELVDKSLIKTIFNNCSFEDTNIKRDLTKYVDIAITPDEINDDYVCCELVKYKKIKTNKENLIKCKDKIETLIMLLINDQSLVEFVKNVALGVDGINKILENTDILFETKLVVIRDYERLINDNIGNTKLCGNTLLVINENKSFVFNPDLMSELLKNTKLPEEIYMALINTCFDLYSHTDSILFFQKMQPKLYEQLIKHENYKSKVETIEIENNPFVDGLRKKRIISLIRKSKNNTALNVSGLIKILESNNKQ